jgi:hypothetical protein
VSRCRISRQLLHRTMRRSHFGCDILCCWKHTVLLESTPFPPQSAGLKIESH